MLIEVILSLLAGVLAGTITGLLPGIHINLVGTFLVVLSTSLLSSISPLFLVVFITSMAITHTFLDFIPSIFLGCPDDDTGLAVLPGHELLKQGRGYEAVYLTALGGLAAIFLVLLIAFPAIFLVPKIYNSILRFIPYLLIGISLFMLLSEKKKFSAFLVFFLSGILGLIVLNINLKEPLLPLLSGLFGSSSLLLSIKQKTKIPAQEANISEKPKLLRPLSGSFIASFICGFLPGLGSGEAAVIGSQISKAERKNFLVLLGATNTLVMGLAFIAFYTIGKTRTGVLVSIQQIIGNLTARQFILVLAIILLAGIISFFLTLQLAKFFSNKIEKINYSTLSILTLIFVTVIVTAFSGFLGLLVFIISTLTGIYCISLNVRRTTMMSCLLLPTIWIYLGKIV
jgi:putative membrane protein